MAAQDIISRSPDYNAASVFRDPAYHAVLSSHGVLNRFRAQVHIVQHIRGIPVDIRNELLVKSALLRGKGGHLLIIEGYAELFSDQLSDLLPRRAVLTGDRDDNSRL